MKNLKLLLSKILLIICCCLVCVLEIEGQVTVIIENLPKNTPENAKIYAAGNFNSWQPQELELQKNDDNEFFVTFTKAKFPIEYKFTRGSWKTVESDKNGEQTANRTILKNTKTITKVSIAGWEDLLKQKAKTTANENITILTDSFYMPQLNRFRRVWIYLPSDYEASDKEYPVLYMHDGQNLFDNNTSYSGEWKVDETLLQLEKDKHLKIIVVAVDNGSEHRMNEYNPWIHKKFGGGEGNAYLKFLTKTLKPEIDKKYRTLSGASNTGIMGSSMGGLISMYGIMEYSNIFGKAGVFSPSFWISKSAFTQVKSNASPENMKIYMLMGGKEGSNMTKVMNKMTKILQKKGFDNSNLFSLTVADGVHHESFWEAEFAKAVLWLFQ